MLKVRNLHVSYDGQFVINNIDLTLRPGQSLGIIGESGTGKTTLGFALIGLIGERAANGCTTGTIQFGDEDLNKLDTTSLRSIRWTRISMVFQNVDEALNPVYRVFDQVKEPLKIKGIGDRTDADVHDMLSYFEVPESRRHAYPHELSIGEKQKVLLAMAFICDPELVILDEPTTALDALSRTRITERLRELFKERMSLVITHDLGTISKLADNTAVLYGGSLLESGPSERLFSAPLHPYTRGLVRSFPDMKRTKDLQGIKGRATFPKQGCPFQPRCTQAIELCGKSRPRLVQNEGHRIACHRGGVIPLLSLSHVSTVLDGTVIVRDVSFSLYEGETLVVVGESGAGKTTLAKTVLGLIPLAAGEIALEGVPAQQEDPAFRQRVQLVFQNPSEAVSHRFNVFQAVKEPLDIQKLGSREERRQMVMQALRDAELPVDDAFLHRYPHELSGGEKQRIVIARALVLQPKILIADEPTSSLDASVQAKILKLLNGIQERRGLSMLLITHNLALARKAADRIAIMKSGRIIELGNTETVLDSPEEDYTQQLIYAADKL